MEPTFASHTRHLNTQHGAADLAPGKPECHPRHLTTALRKTHRLGHPEVSTHARQAKGLSTVCADVIAAPTLQALDR